MALSALDKSVLYHELHRYVHAGLDLPRAVDSFLTERSPSSIREVMKRVHDQLTHGKSVEQAFTDPAFTQVEQAMLGAAETSGRLDQTLSYLSRYFQAISDSARTIRRNLAYPIFLVHFAALILPLPTIVSHGVHGYLMRVVAALAAIYVAGLSVWGICWLLARLSEKDPTMDTVVQNMPVVGAARRNLALARLFASLEMLLSAGIGLPRALGRAAETTHSALFESSVRKAVPDIEMGFPAQDALRRSGGFPEQVLRGIQVGLETGTLDVEMGRWSAFYWQKAQDSVQALSKWVPRMIYLAIVIGIGYQVITLFQSVIGQQSKLLDDL